MLSFGIDEVKSGDVGKLTGRLQCGEIVITQNDLGFPEQQITLLTNAVAHSLCLQTLSGPSQQTILFGDSSHFSSICLQQRQSGTLELTKCINDGTYPSNPGPGLSTFSRAECQAHPCYDFDEKHTGLSYAKILIFRQVSP